MLHNFKISYEEMIDFCVAIRRLSKVVIVTDILRLEPLSQGYSCPEAGGIEELSENPI